MTSVLAYPMSDPFASAHPASTDAGSSANAGRRHLSFAPQPAQLAPPAPSRAATTSANFVLPPPPRSYSASANEFGAYSAAAAAAAAASQSAPGTRTSQPAHAPITAPPLPVPGAYASSSGSGPSHALSTGAARKRQSHNPSTMLQSSVSLPAPEMLTEEYVLHPSVWAYRDAHPRRPMVGFGPYVLLQTLGEGEFGKVKLGVHNEYGVETAIKLIRRGSLDDEARASKVEREIDVLKSLKHPNIVRMFDVIDTEKYIGIVLEFAGGGELFDFILAQKCLNEKDATRLFAQLISGVDYLHQKHIIHRDLKLENLLLDKHRNIIITDFGFANRFEYENDDLMATSCGSPCYAAPELVVSEGMYVGSAVDVWSCGVILYAMLSGYLPFDDDPENPEGDNLNLLYHYIMSTELKFPDHLSPEAMHLLSIMIVPDPDYRCTIQHIMEHPWLEAYRGLFARTVEEHEYIFSENMYRKSQQAKRELQARRYFKDQYLSGQMRAPQRSQSSAPGTAVTAAMLDKHRRQQRHQSAMPTATTMPHIADRTVSTSATSMARSSRGSTPAAHVALPTPRLAPTFDLVSPALTASTVASTPQAIPTPVMSAPPVVLSPQQVPVPVLPESVPVETMTINETADDAGAETKPRLSANKNRHTIQVEYDGEASYEAMTAALDAQALSSPSPTDGSSTPIPALSPEPLDTVTSLSDAELSTESVGHSTASSAAEPAPITPIAAIAGVMAAPPAVAAPSTPTKRTRQSVDEASQATPKASARGREEAVTPRAELTPRPVLRPTEPPQPVVLPKPATASAKRASMPAKARPPPPVVTNKPFVGVQTPSQGQNKHRTRKGMSLDKFGLARILGQATAAQDEQRRGATPQPPPSAGASAAAIQLRQQESRDREQAQASRGKRGSLGPPLTMADDKKGRRKTLQLMNRAPTPREDSLTSPTSVATSTATDAAQQRSASPIVPAGADGRSPAPVEQYQGSLSHAAADTYQAPVSRDTPTPAPDSQPRRSHKHSASVSSNAAKKVMDWFRRKSLAKDTTLTGLRQPGIRADSTSSFVRVSVSPVPGAQPAAEPAVHVETTQLDAPLSATNSVAHYAMSSTSSIGNTAEAEGAPSVVKTSTLAVPANARQPLAPAGSKVNMDLRSTPDLPLPSHEAQVLPQRSKSHRPTPSTDASTSTTLSPASQAPARSQRASVPTKSTATRAAVAEDKIRYFPGGPVTQAALTNRPPADVMADVIAVLQAMGIEVKKETEWRLRCTRVRRRKAGPTTGLGLGSVMGTGSVGGFSLMGSASMSRTDSRGLPVSSSQSGIGSGLKGMLLRRGSSYSSHAAGLASPKPSTPGLGPANPVVQAEPLYGEHSIDNGDEVKFIVELCKMRNLSNLYHLNIRRLRGSVWSFKFIYETTIDRCQTLTH
ncbi:hypothetical protein Q5752_005728 [Cryptotrichosporon argae]